VVRANSLAHAIQGLIVRAYLRVLEHYRSRQIESEPQLDVNGIPVPPAQLRVLVAGVPNRDWFLRSGQAQTNHLRDLLAGFAARSKGWAPFSTSDADAAEWRDGGLTSPECRSMVRLQQPTRRWCDANLPFVNAKETELEPPLPYSEGSFDFLYAFSVFTHMSVELASAWVREFERVVRPGGLVWFTIHGMSYRARLPEDQRRRLTKARSWSGSRRSREPTCVQRIGQMQR